MLQNVGLQVTTTTDVDTEAAGIVMLLEIVLVLGFVVPVVPVVVCVAFLLHASLSDLLSAPNSQVAA